MAEKRKRTLSTTLIYVLMGLLTLLIIINFYLGINKAVTHNPVPKVLGFSPLIVLSGSMEPAIYPGDVIVIREQEAEKYQIGDIASYLDGQTVFTHRIIGEENGQFILKGDNNNIADDLISPEQFVGKVLLIIPKVGLAIVFFKKPTGLAFLALLVLLYIFSEDINELVKKVRRKKDQK